MNLYLHCVLGSIPVEVREQSLLEISEAFSHLYPSNKYIEFGQTFEYNIERTFKYVCIAAHFIVHIYSCAFYFSEIIKLVTGFLETFLISTQFLCLNCKI